MGSAKERVSGFELHGKRYVVLEEADYRRLLDAAGGAPPAASGWAAWEKDASGLGERLAERRREAGLSQVSLARLAGIRVETLNRIERGHVVPDYGTVRKLVLALRGGSVTARARRVRLTARGGGR